MLCSLPFFPRRDGRASSEAAKPRLQSVLPVRPHHDLPKGDLPLLCAVPRSSSTAHSVCKKGVPPYSRPTSSMAPSARLAHGSLHIRDPSRRQHKQRAPVLCPTKTRGGASRLSGWKASKMLVPRRIGACGPEGAVSGRGGQWVRTVRKCKARCYAARNGNWEIDRAVRVRDREIVGL